MTIAKRPLPSLRMVIRPLAGDWVVKLIPQTTPRGKVLPDLWAMPGGQIWSTEKIKSHCAQKLMRCEIVGDDGSRRRGRPS